MKSKIFLSLLVIPLIAAEVMQAQSAYIRGKAPAFKQQLIEVVAVLDFVTLKSKYVAQTRIQDDGSFNCEIPVSPDTVPALYFSLAGSRTQLQLSPGKSYEFYIPATDPSQLGITENNDTADRWYALAQFETYYTNYVLENEKALRSPDYKKVIQAFAKDAMEKFGNHPDPFVAATVRYRVAGTQLALQIGSARQIISEHVAGKPVLYDHPEYMDFFMALYPQLFSEWAMEIKDSTIRHIVLQGSNYDSLLQAVHLKPEITGREVAELCIVSGLYHMYKEKLIKEPQIRPFLQQAYTQVVHPSLKRIIRNVLSQIDHLKPGTEFPELRSKRADGSDFSTRSLLGKSVYLMFFEASNPASLSELLSARIFPDRYKGELVLVGICTDCNFTMLDKLVKEYKLRGDFVISTPEIMEQFEMVGEFTAFLIDKGGKVVHAPAKTPGQGGDGQIYDLLRKVPRK